MPSDAVCVHCGRAVDAAVTIPSGNTVATLCQWCAGWQRVHGSDQEDHEDTTGLGALRPAPHRNDTARRTMP